MHDKFGRGKNLECPLCVQALTGYYAFLLFRKNILKIDGIGK